MTQVKSLVIIPTYNERENLIEVTNRVLSQGDGVEVLIVDDASPDGTGELAEQLRTRNPRIHVLRRSGKQGLGTAYIAGFKYALERDYDYIFEMDADLSHDPKYLPRFIDKIQEGYDLVIGSRYIKGISVVHWAFKRLLLSLWASYYAKKITGVPLTDPMAGFKCFRREVLEALPLDRINSNGYSFQIEMHYRVYQSGFKITEIPIIFVERREGESKMSRRVIKEAVLMPWRLRLGLYSK